EKKKKEKRRRRKRRRRRYDVTSCDIVIASKYREYILTSLSVLSKKEKRKKNSNFTEHPTNLIFKFSRFPEYKISRMDDPRKSFEIGKRDAESLKVPTWKVVGTKWGESVGGLSFPVCRVLATIPEGDTEHTVTLIQRTILSRLGFTPFYNQPRNAERCWEMLEIFPIVRPKRTRAYSPVGVQREGIVVNYPTIIPGLSKHHVIIVKASLQFCIISKLNPAIGDFESSLTSSVWMGITRWAMVSTNRAVNSKPSWLVRFVHD
ncbi:hypothetical protein V1478_008842, partial [Vespula squamosa]